MDKMQLIEDLASEADLKELETASFAVSYLREAIDASLKCRATLHNQKLAIEALRVLKAQAESLEVVIDANLTFAKAQDEALRAKREAA